MSPRHNIRSLVAALTFAGGLACDTDVTVSHIAVELHVTPLADTLAVGASAGLFRPVALNYAGDTVVPAVRWTIADPAVARIDSTSGVITARAPGITRVIAHTATLTDTVTLTVIGPPSLRVVLDTILLLPGDTFTARVIARGTDGQGIPVSFAGGEDGIATISPVGLVTAQAAGRTAFTVSADTLTASGVIEVAPPADTATGLGMIALSGSISRQVRMAGRWSQYPDSATGSVVRVLLAAGGGPRLQGTLRDSLDGPGSRTIGAHPGADSSAAICDPPASWMAYADTSAPMPVDARSGSTAGAVRVQRFEAIEGGYRISATFDLVLRREGIGGSASQVVIIGRYVGALLSQAACPAATLPSAGTRPARR